MTQDLVALARGWADELPRDFARRLAVALRLGPDAVHHLRAEAVLPPSDAAVRMAMDVAVKGDGPFVAGLLVGRLESVIEQPTVTPVWTGPESEPAQGRLTLAVLADLIEETRRELLLVSYATMPSENVRAAVSAAADRGVAITMLLERTADNPRFESHGEPFPGISARKLCWPAADRPVGASMHAKVLVVDRRTALIGSANLTGYGLERNLECGVLIRGGHVPALLVEHLLSARGVREAY